MLPWWRTYKSRLVLFPLLNIGFIFSSPSCFIFFLFFVSSFSLLFFSQNAFVCNLESHWFCLRRINNVFYILNSLYEQPVLLSDFALEASISSFKEGGEKKKRKITCSVDASALFFCLTLCYERTRVLRLVRLPLLFVSLCRLSHFTCAGPSSSAHASGWWDPAVGEGGFSSIHPSPRPFFPLWSRCPFWLLSFVFCCFSTFRV